MKLLTAGFILLSFTTFGQKNILDGIIMDADTGLPVPFANVFFANTTIGVSSDSDGKFQLKDFASGKYDLMVAYVGYTNFQTSLEFNGTQLRVSIELSQRPVLLNEVIVKENSSQRAENMLLFKKFFLGETENSKHCKIVNPEIIHLFYDSSARVLVAHAKMPIQIKNDALGFQIDYYLQSFELNFGSDQISYFGVPLFQNLQPKNRHQENQWKRERERAYQGSMEHFFRSLRSNQLKKEGYVVKRLYRIPNPERPPQQMLNARINELQVNQNKNRSTSSKADSLNYYRKLNSLPPLIDSLSTQELVVSEVLDTDKNIHYQGFLAVLFKKEKEEYGYVKRVRSASYNGQYSVIQFLSDSLLLYPNGYYEDPRDVYVENYWSWSEKISDLLPYDYQPLEKK